MSDFIKTFFKYILVMFLTYKALLAIITTYLGLPSYPAFGHFGANLAIDVQSLYNFILYFVRMVGLVLWYMLEFLEIIDFYELALGLTEKTFHIFSALPEIYRIIIRLYEATGPELEWKFLKSPSMLFFIDNVVQTYLFVKFFRAFVGIWFTK